MEKVTSQPGYFYKELQKVTPSSSSSAGAILPHPTPLTAQERVNRCRGGVGALAGHTQAPESPIHRCDTLKWNFVLPRVEAPQFKLTDLLVIQDVVRRLDVEQDFRG